MAFVLALLACSEGSFDMQPRVPTYLGPFNERKGWCFSNGFFKTLVVASHSIIGCLFSPIFFQ